MMTLSHAAYPQCLTMYNMERLRKPNYSFIFLYTYFGLHYELQTCIGIRAVSHTTLRF